MQTASGEQSVLRIEVSGSRSSGMSAIEVRWFMGKLILKGKTPLVPNLCCVAIRAIRKRLQPQLEPKTPVEQPSPRSLLNYTIFCIEALRNGSCVPRSGTEGLLAPRCDWHSGKVGVKPPQGLSIISFTARIITRIPNRPQCGRPLGGHFSSRTTPRRTWQRKLEAKNAFKFGTSANDGTNLDIA